MAEYLAPAVYVEEVSFRAPSIEGVGTTTTGFAGPALTGPVSGTPQLLTSFGDYQSIYGGFDQLSLQPAGDPKNTNYLALSVKAFFDNGGSRLYVSRVYSAPAGNDGTASATFSSVTVRARFPGAFANNQTVTASLIATKTSAANLTTLPPGSVVAVANDPAAPLGLLVAGIDAGAVTITVTTTVTAPAPTFVTVGAEQMLITAIAANATPGHTDLTVARGQNGTQPAQHNANDPVSATLYLSYFGNGNGTTFANGATPMPAVPASASVYVLTATVSTFGAASAKLSAPAAQPVLTYAGLGFDPLHANYIGATLGDTPPRHIDALQNQISVDAASTITTPIGLLTALFGNWSGPGTQATQTFVLAGGSDGGDPEAGDYDTALAALDALEDIAIVAAPGSSAFTDRQAIVATLITHVSRPRAYRIALLDTGVGGLASDYEDVRAQIDSTYAALYVPWVKMSNPLARSGTSIPAQVLVPPSGFMAGIYARSDDQNSVAKAPANEVVLDALDFERRITFAEQAVLNPLGINCLRYFPDRGYRVWGARTTSSDSEFMYVNVRRYLVYLEHSIDDSTQWAVFENNGPTLWARVKDSVDSFLNNEFVEGRLLGTSPSDAYFVRCDRTTMTQNDLDNGRMICLIGVSVLKPAEFVIFRIGQWTATAPS